MSENTDEQKQTKSFNLRNSIKFRAIAKSITSLLSVRAVTPSGNRSFTPDDPQKLSIQGEVNPIIIHDSRLNSVSGSSANLTATSVDSEIESYIKNLLLTSNKDLPVLIPDDSDNFCIEGFIGKHDGLLKYNLDDYYIKDYELNATNRAYVNYSQYFYGKEHFNFIGRYENNESNNFVLSIRYEKEKFECIFRNKEGNEYDEYEVNELNNKSNEESIDDNTFVSEGHIIQLFYKICPNVTLQELKPVIHPLASQMIDNYDKPLLKNTFTFGIIYQKFGQSNEREIFGNSDNSKDFDEFLNFIGQRVTLKNFNKFRGMLDTKNDDTGKESVYEVHDDSEIMFHVSTLLPASSNDHQYIERKRHIGNDRVAIVFQDQDTPFSPRMIKSKLLHVFIIVQPVKINNITKRYKISCMLKKGVNFFGPNVRQPCIFEKDENLKRFLLSKLINAEFASLKAPAFSSFSEQTIKPGLLKLCSKLNQLTYNFTWINEQDFYNDAYLYQKDPNKKSLDSPFDVHTPNFMNQNDFGKPPKPSKRGSTDALRDLTSSKDDVKETQETRNLMNLSRKQSSGEELQLSFAKRSIKAFRNSRSNSVIEQREIVPTVKQTVEIFEKAFNPRNKN